MLTGKTICQEKEGQEIQRGGRGKSKGKEKMAKKRQKGKITLINVKINCYFLGYNAEKWKPSVSE